MNEKTITLYTYEYYNHSLEMYCASDFNWTTAEQLCNRLANKNVGLFRITSKEFSIEEIKNRPNMPFISDYVREAIK